MSCLDFLSFIPLKKDLPGLLGGKQILENLLTGPKYNRFFQMSEVRQDEKP